MYIRLLKHFVHRDLILRTQSTNYFSLHFKKKPPKCTKTQFYGEVKCQIYAKKETHKAF